MPAELKKPSPSIEDLIVSRQAEVRQKPSLVEALLSTVDSIFTGQRKMQKSRLTARQIRGMVRIIATQTYSRATLEPTFAEFISPETGEFTTGQYDNRVLTAIGDAVITGRISLNGASRDEIIRIFQAVGGAAHEEQAGVGNALRRFDY